MMELTCAVVLVLAALGSATPHGYHGVKGGASARADASASSGAFGGSGIPVPVPFGAGYSGSFSKSSSSSSSSSSASSSSSSSSFSYNGSGVGHPGFGNSGATATGGGGCGSGSCQFGGAHGISANHGAGDAGAGLQTYNAANAAATAGAAAGTLPGPGCQGSDCNDHYAKCSSGKCKPHVSSESGNKCSSGQCGSEQGDNDIYVNTDTTKSINDNKEQTANYGKKETGYTGAVSDCSTGNCGSLAATKPEAHGTINGYGSSLSNNNQHSTTLDSDIFVGYHKPASYLETPKLGSSCASGNCGSGPAEAGTGNLPSSYNVPIHGTYNTNGDKPACTSGNCDPNTNSNSPSTNYLIPQGSHSAHDIPKSPSSVQSPSHAAGAINCVGQHCGTPGTQTGHTFTTPSLSQVHSGLPSHSTGCKTPDCGSYPGAGFPSDGVTKPNYETGLSNNKLPEHVGSYGSPTNKPNEAAVPTLTGGPSYTHSITPSFIAPVIVPSTSFGVTTNPGSLPTASAGATAGADAHIGSLGVTKPDTSTKVKLPAYTGGFGGPVGILKPNEFNAIPGKPGYPHSGPTAPSSNTVTTGCKTPNCGSYPNAAATATAGANAQTVGVVKPNVDASSPNEKLPPYTGGFGGPAGVLAPIHGHGSVPHSPGYSHSGFPSSAPSVSGNTAGCNTPNCAGYPSAVAQSSAGANAVSGSFDLNKPSAGLTPADQKLPGYTGGFGAPAGVLKPTLIGVPAGASISPAVPHPESPSYSTPSASGPSNTCTTPNCANPAAGAAADAHTGSFDATKPSTALPEYTGGFGGPSGIHSPNEYRAPAPVLSSPSGAAPTDCKTLNCASAGYPAGVHKPDYVHGAGPNNPSISHSGSPSYNTPSGNSGYHTVGVTAGSNAQSGTFGVTKPSGGDLTSEKLPVYTGGFGAPAGVLKPNVAGAPITGASSPSFAHTGSPLYNAPSTTGTSGCKTLNCGSYPSAGAGAEAGANAQAGSHGVTKPVSDSSWDENLPPYKGGFGGPSGLLKPSEYTVPAVGVSPAVGVTPVVGITPAAGVSPSVGVSPVVGVSPAIGVSPIVGVTPAVDLSKHTGAAGNSKPASCTSGACAHHISSPHEHSGSSNGVQATAGASASADAVAYTGGFGGPSGYLKPYDDGKFGAAGAASKQTSGTQFGSHHAPSGISSHGDSDSGSQAVSIAQAEGTGLASGAAQASAVAHAGATAAATSGAISGYNLHGQHSDHSGHGVKGGCSGGCGGSHSGGSNFGYSGGLGLSQHGYVDGLGGSLSSSGASAKSLAGANAFSHGVSFASSSATAHAAPGASVKGGYGRR